MEDKLDSDSEDDAKSEFSGCSEVEREGGKPSHHITSHRVSKALARLEAVVAGQQATVEGLRGELAAAMQSERKQGDSELSQVGGDGCYLWLLVTTRY